MSRRHNAERPDQELEVMKREYQETFLERSMTRNGGLGLGIGVIGVVGLWGIVIRERHKNSVQNK